MTTYDHYLRGPYHSCDVCRQRAVEEPEFETKALDFEEFWKLRDSEPSSAMGTVMRRPAGRKPPGKGSRKAIDMLNTDDDEDW